MLTEYGHRALLAGLVKPYSLRLKLNATDYGVEFKLDPGYPKFGDTDPANTGKGPNVLSWAFTVPKGTDWGQGMATGGMMMDGDQQVYFTRLEPFRPSPNHPCKVYINIMLRKL